MLYGKNIMETVCQKKSMKRRTGKAPDPAAARHQAVHAQIPHRQHVYQARRLFPQAAAESGGALRRQAKAAAGRAAITVRKKSVFKPGNRRQI